MPDGGTVPEGGTLADVESDVSASVRTIERAAGALATASVSRMDDVLPWFRGLPADQRSWVMLVAQSGVRSFVEWLRRSGNDQPHELSDEIFDAAPRTLARSISLQHTVQLIKVTIDVVEEQVPHLAAEGERQAVADAVLRFSREVAFSAARVYARAAESRGTWDARLQALLVDALLRGDTPTRSLAGRPPWAGTTARRSRSRWAARRAATPTPSCTRCTGLADGWASMCWVASTAAGWCWSSAAPKTRSGRRRSSSAASATGRWWSGPAYPPSKTRPNRHGRHWPDFGPRRPGPPPPAP